DDDRRRPHRAADPRRHRLVPIRRVLAQQRAVDAQAAREVRAAQASGGGSQEPRHGTAPRTTDHIPSYPLDATRMTHDTLLEPHDITAEHSSAGPMIIHHAPAS